MKTDVSFVSVSFLFFLALFVYESDISKTATTDAGPGLPGHYSV